MLSLLVRLLMLTTNQRKVLRHGRIILDFISKPLAKGIYQSNFQTKTNDILWMTLPVFRSFQARSR
ncbi:MAG TPA: hypothetical protein DD687_06895 [Verrucomicrobiales bacterium]|jgi:hypothetical protein|nr:hypothetical protein [Verrucomicrobiales bacterium]